MIVVFCARVLFYLVHVYPPAKTALVFVFLLSCFQPVAGWLFPYRPDLSRDAWNHVMAIPVLFSVTLTHAFCLAFFRSRSIHYRWEGEILHLVDGERDVSIELRDISAVSSIGSSRPRKSQIRSCAVSAGVGGL